MMRSSFLLACIFVWGGAQAQAQPRQVPIAQYEAELHNKWGGFITYSGITPFAHLPHYPCLVTPRQPYDIAIHGAPLDTTSSHRSGARFGPRLIRTASSRQSPARGYDPRARLNPFLSWARVVDCGDVHVSSLDNELARRQLDEAFLTLGRRPAAWEVMEQRRKRAGKNAKGEEMGVPFDVDREYGSYPKVITLGGDPSVSLSALRALRRVYGQPIAVLHFGAEAYTQAPDPEQVALRMPVTSESVFRFAAEEGLIANGSSVHVGVRAALAGVDYSDYHEDSRLGFRRITVDEIDDLETGTAEAAQKIHDILTGSSGSSAPPVYISIDMNVLDPGLAPSVSAPVPGGLYTRELVNILRMLDGLNVVGADVVGLVQGYEGNESEKTAFAAAQVVYEVLTSMVARGTKRAESI